jgi:hypothetical protein
VSAAGQSRIASAVEAAANVLGGYVVALAAQMLIFPLYGVRLSLFDNLSIGAWFAAIGIIRGFAFRRLFNRMQIRRSA